MSLSVEEWTAGMDARQLRACIARLQEEVEAMRARCEAIARNMATHPDRSWSTAAFLIANEIAAIKVGS